MLKVSHNRRFLQYSDGRPFFYLGDTAWELFHRLTREEAEAYLADRAAKRFSVIQAVALAEHDGLNVPNAYGQTPLEGNDPTRPIEAYWEHVDYIVTKANAFGLVMGLLPTWGDKYEKAWGIGPEVFTPENARVYGRWLAQRYARSQVIWILGGDRQIGERHLPIIRAMAEGIREVVGGSQLITFHPMGGDSSSTFVGAEPWLDFNMVQTGHQRDRDSYNFIDRDYRRLPVRPVLDGEPGYEDHPNCFNPELGWLDHHDVRKSLYWSVFAGACGYTYGCHDIWQMHRPEKPLTTTARMPWREALNLPGASQVQHCRSLIESRPYFTRIPDWRLIRGNAGTGGDHVRGCRCSEGCYAMVYIPSGQRVTVDLPLLGCSRVRVWWFNPRNGESLLAGEHENAAPIQFQPPNHDLSGRDWVLVADNAECGFGQPGR